MKLCSRCREAKDDSAFQRNGSAKDGLQDQCRECRRVTDRQTYVNRSEEQKARYREQDRQVAERNAELLYNYLMQHPCVDCGEADPIVLEFDHIRGEKHAYVGNLATSGRSWQTVLNEIEKCEVRCANCHRRVTAKRNGTWKKYIWSLEISKPT